MKTVWQRFLVHGADGFHTTGWSLLATPKIPIWALTQHPTRTVGMAHLKRSGTTASFMFGKSF